MGLIKYLMKQLDGGQKFLTGTQSVKDSAKSGQPVTVTRNANVLIVRKM